jgi:site-specific recombinase XerD
VAWSPAGEAGKTIAKQAREMRSGLLFRKSTGQPLSMDAVQSQFKRIGNEIGINLEPHKLRRTWCSQSIAAGMPPQMVMRLGGWSNLDVVERYLHLATDQQINLAHKFARV